MTPATAVSRRCSIAVVLFGCIALAGSRGVAETASGVHYRLTFPEVRQRIMQVDLTIPASAGPVELVMSRSSPGRYALHEFAKNVLDVQASDDAGRTLAVERPASHRWLVPAHDGGLRVRYRIYGDRVDGTYLAIDETHAHINAPAALMWVRGLETTPATVQIVPPPESGWHVATQLFKTADPFTFTAPNLAYLADSPIEVSRHVLRTFRPPVAGGGQGPLMSLALHAGSAANEDRYVDGLTRIVSEEAAIFGEYAPFDGGEYTFLADYLPSATGDGMEHRNSSVLTGNAAISESTRFLLDTAAHEFFHSWNVERIRPRTLEPFDLEATNPSGELWLAEGLTTYYEKLVLQRTRLATLSETLQEWSAVLNQVLGSPAIRRRSAEAMSRMAPFVDGPRPLDRTNWNYSYLSYYVHGAALGLALDLSLREHTGGRHTLDDFMRAMWLHHGRPGGAPVGTVAAPYTMDDVRARLAEVSGDAAFADAFIAKYVQGHDTPDFAHLLALAGLRVRKAAPGRGSLGQVPLVRSGSGLRIAAPLAPGSPLGDAGVAEDDEIVAVDGHEVTGPDVLEREIQRHAPGSRLALQFVPRGAGAPRTVDVSVIEYPVVVIAPAESLGEALTPEQRAFRDSWLSKRGL